jgi:hypothetical protein
MSSGNVVWRMTLTSWVTPKMLDKMLMSSGLVPLRKGYEWPSRRELRIPARKNAAACMIP